MMAIDDFGLTQCSNNLRLLSACLGHAIKPTFGIPSVQQLHVPSLKPHLIDRSSQKHCWVNCIDDRRASEREDHMLGNWHGLLGQEKLNRGVAQTIDANCAFQQKNGENAFDLAVISLICRYWRNPFPAAVKRKEWLGIALPSVG